MCNRLNVQVTADRRQTVPDRNVVRSCNPLKTFGEASDITGMAEPIVVKFCRPTQVGYINSSYRMTYKPTNGNDRVSDFRGLVTLTFDRVILHTVMHRSSTSTYIPNFIEIEGTDGRGRAYS